MARQYRSRLARKESKRMMRQSIFLFILTGIFVAVLFKWGIPAIIRMSSFLGELRASNDPIATDDTLPPYTPQLAIPYEATSSAQITISGYAEAGTKIKLFNNDEEIASTDSDETSSFSFPDIKLIDGENIFYVTSTDSANNASDPSQETNVVFDNVSPSITITEPADGSSYYGFAEQTITVKGNVSEEADIYVGGRITFANDEGDYSQQVRLESGENEIEVKAIDPAGNETSEKIKVTFAN